jgi:putative two-component system response regulator
MNKPTILIVDDEPINLMVLDELLNSDYSVRACKSG